MGEKELDEMCKLVSKCIKAVGVENFDKYTYWLKQQAKKERDEYWNKWIKDLSQDINYKMAELGDRFTWYDIRDLIKQKHLENKKS